MCVAEVSYKNGPTTIFCYSEVHTMSLYSDDGINNYTFYSKLQFLMDT